MSQYDEQDAQKIKQMLSRLLDHEDIDNDTDIYQAGLTSVMVLPFLSEIEDTFSLKIPDNEFLDAHTPRALAEIVHRLRQN